jgi:hypothetical protein
MAARLVSLQDRYTGQIGQAAREEGLFLTWGMSNFIGTSDATSLGTGTEAVTTYAPTAFNMEALLDDAVAMGMTYVVFTVIHANGFALWPTATTTRSVGNAALAGTVAGMDLVKAFVEGCRKRGLKPRLYFTIQNYTAEQELGGVPTAGNIAAWLTYLKAQLTELLTNYGLIDAIWIDQWWNYYSNAITLFPVATLRNHIKSLQPNCLLVSSNHLWPSSHGVTWGTPTPASITVPAIVNDGTQSDVFTNEYPFDIVGNLYSAGQTTYPIEQGFTCLTKSSLVAWFDYSGVVPTFPDFLSYVEWTNDIREVNAVPLSGLSPQRDGTYRSTIRTPVLEGRNFLRMAPLNIGCTATATSSYPGLSPASSNVWYANDYRVNASDGTTSTYSNTAAGGWIVKDFWASAVGDNNPAWTTDLGSTKPVYEVVVMNRPDGAILGRMRDVTIELLAADGTTVVATSGLLNANNVLGGGIADYSGGPAYLRATLNGQGRYVRIRRTGNGSSGGNETLCLGAVHVYAESLATSKVRTLDRLAVNRSGFNATLTFSHAGATSFEYLEDEVWQPVVSPFVATGDGYKTQYKVRALDNKRNILATSTWKAPTPLRTRNTLSTV